MHAPWDIRVSIDLFLGGLGIGAFLLAVLLNWYNRERYAGLVKIVTVLAPITVGVGLLFLIWETGRPERMYLTTVNMNPTSAVPWGGSAQGAFIGLGFFYALLQLFNRKKDLLFRLVEVGSVFFALVTGLFHGFLMAASGRPLWAGGMTTIVFLSSSLLGGTALVLLLNALKLDRFLPAIFQAKPEMEVADSPEFNFASLLFGLSAVNICSVFIWMAAVPRIGLEASQTMDLMLAEFGTVFYLIAIAAGLLVPFVVSCYYALASRAEHKMPGTVACTLSVLIIAGGFIYKHAVLTAGQFFIERWP